MFLITFLVALGALLLAMVGSAILDPRLESDQEAEEAAEERFSTMEATPFF